jgi:hypothetical protein
MCYICRRHSVQIERLRWPLQGRVIVAAPSTQLQSLSYLATEPCGASTISAIRGGSARALVELGQLAR